MKKVMENPLENILKAVGVLTAGEIADGLRYFKCLKVKKNDYLIEAGDICNWIAFVTSGILRNFYISSKDEEVTYCLTFPNHFITAYSSFITQEKTFENIHAITDAEVLIIKRNHYAELIESSSNWLKFSNIFAGQSYLLMENRLLALQMESAEKRYHDLLKHQPDYLQKVPLKYLASYLGITQRHLSRLRKNLSF